MAIELDNAIAIVNGRTPGDAFYGLLSGIIQDWNALQAAQQAAINRHDSFEAAREMQGFGQDDEPSEFESSEGLQGMEQLDGIPEEIETPPEK